MINFGTMSEERAKDHFIIRMHVYKNGAEIYSRDVAGYVKEGKKWHPVAIGSQNEIAVSPVAMTKTEARRIANRTANMMIKITEHKIRQGA